MNQKLYFTGPKEFIAPNSEVTLNVLLDSTNPINAFELGVDYDKEKLKFLGSDNTGSIVDIWQTKPTNTSDGQIDFSGGILNDFSGAQGLIVKLSFKVLDAGVTMDNLNVFFAKNYLYLADGKGTKVEAPVLDFSLQVKKDAKVFASPFIPFESTRSDKIIEKELNNFKSKMFYEKTLTPMFIFIVFIFVICIWAVYNKRK